MNLSKTEIKKTNQELYKQEFNGSLNNGIWDYTITNGTAISSATLDAQNKTYTLGQIRYEISDHLGHVRATITDRKLATVVSGHLEYSPDIATAQDYYLDFMKSRLCRAFDMLMPGRQYTNVNLADDNRCGFYGQEGDRESNGNSYAFKYRINEKRTVRFYSLNPFAPDYPRNVPYAFSEPRILEGIELEGLEFLFIHLVKIQVTKGQVMLKTRSMPKQKCEMVDPAL